MDYASALSFLYGRVNYEQRSPRPGDLKLDRMHALLRLLGEPHNRLRVVHVAGSKGKGSTSAMLASVLRRAGYRTGLFTSPHLCRIEERIQIDGCSVAPEEFAALTADLVPAVAVLDARYHEPGARPTFFELVTALGFLAFVRRRVDVAVLEVGLGGRFDATNVVRRPLACLIASISYDHTQQLGPTLARIAREKAGIVKPGVLTISGATAPEAREVIAAVCRQRHAPLAELGREFRYRYEPGQVTAAGTTPPRVEVITRRRCWPVMELGLLGEHQAANAAVVVATVERLREQGLRLDDDAVAQGLAEVRWPARLEVLGQAPWVVLDCAHNVASAQAVVDTLRESFPLPPGGRRLLVFAGSSDKDLAGMFAVLAPAFAEAYLTRYTNNPRGVAADRLAELWRQVSPRPAVLCATPAEAWQQARAAAGPDDLVCITGSVFLAGELRPRLIEDQKQPYAAAVTC